jgi:hypothetical protein
MSQSTTSTIALNGNTTGYGLSSGNELFNLSGYDNTVLMYGASDAVDILSGQNDVIDLNTDGFINAVTDNINLGSSAFDIVKASHTLYAATLNVSGSSGPSTVSLNNVGGTTDVSLGNLGDPVLANGDNLYNSVTLNGNATNSVVLTSGGEASVVIGTAGDQLSQYSSTVALSGVSNTVIGGDETFTLGVHGGAGASSDFNTITLGDANNSVMLRGVGNVVTLGSGNNTLTLTGGSNTANLGGGNNVVTTGYGSDRLNFAKHSAGGNDTINLVGGSANVHGGAENFTIVSGATRVGLQGWLGNGNNAISIGTGIVDLTIGASAANTAENTITLGKGEGTFVLNGGVDTLDLAPAAQAGTQNITLNGTLLGTSLSAGGAFDKVTLTQDANATITDNGTNAGLTLVLDADQQGGFGTIAVSGLSHDDLAQIDLVGAGSYNISVDNTPVGGITLNFAHGSVDLVGLQAVPNNLVHG